MGDLKIVFKDNCLFLKKRKGTSFLVLKTQQSEAVWISISKYIKMVMLDQSLYRKKELLSLCLNLRSKNTIQG